MYISIADQTVIFLQAILFGTAVGAYYDFLRAVRGERRIHPLLTALLDGVFWLAVIVCFALFVLLLANGEGRSYVLVGLAGGLALYFLTLSQAVLPLFSGLLAILTSVFGCLCRIAALPLLALRRLAASRGVQKIIHKFNGKNFKKTLPFFKE